MILLINQILVAFDIIPQVHPAGSGFNDDRLYITSLEVNELLKTEGKWNNLYLWICKLLNFNPVFIKIFNTLLLGASVYEVLKIQNLHMKKGNIALYYFLIPSIIVINKEFLFIYLYLTFFRRYLANDTSIQYLLKQSIILALIFNLRYWAVIPGIIALHYQYFKAHRYIFLFLLYPISAMLIILSLDDILLLIQEKLIFRAIEMYSEGQNYGLQSASTALAYKYSGSIWYTILQFLIHPVISPNQLLYNSFLYIPLILVLSTLIDIRELYKRHRWIFLSILYFSITLILLQFGSNPRYKFAPAFLIILALTFSGRVKRRTLFISTIFHIYLLILFYARF